MKFCFITKLLSNDFSERVAFNYVDQNKKVTYLQVSERIRQLQSFLKDQGVEKGDRVLVALDAEDEFLITFVALMSLGAVTVPVGTGLTNHELEKIALVIPFKYSITRFAFITEHSSSLSCLKGLEGIFSLDEGNQDLPEGLIFLHTQATATSKKRDKIQVPLPSQVVTCHYTLKGFGVPLGVEHSYEDYCLSLESSNRIFKFSPGHRVLNLLPTYPIFGLVTNLMYPLMTGSEIISQEKKLSAVLKAIQTYEINHMNIVPVLLEKMLLEASKLDVPMDLSQLCIVVGGSYVTPDLHTQFEKTFSLAPLQGYGLTETLPILTNHPKHSRKGSLGTLMRTGVEMKLMDAKGFEVPDGKAGEICFKGQGILKMYLGGDAHRDSLFRGEWLRTGDIGHLDEEGHVIFVGRKLNFTKVSGNMVDLTEIEDLVKGIHGVKNARSYVLTDKGRDKLSLALFVTRDFSFSRKEILDHCRKSLSVHKIPSFVKIYKSSYDEVKG